jgi:hypothetical protein
MKKMKDIIKKYKIHIIWGLVAVVVLAGGIVGGRLSATPSLSGFGGAAMGGSGSSVQRTTQGMTQGGFTSGKITEVSGSSITLQLPNGSSKVVFFSNSTAVSEPTVVSSSVLVAGTTIIVGGTQNSDGSLTAQTIQIGTAGTTKGMNEGSAAPTSVGR